MTRSSPVESVIRTSRFTIEGRSRAGNETWFRVRELNVALDIGRCPDLLVAVPHIFVTHAHLDHALGIPFYAAQRRLQRLTTGSVYVPREAEEGYRELMRIHESLEGTEYPLDLVGLAPGESRPLRRDLLVRAHRSTHRVPTNAYEFVSERVKLLPEYRQLPGAEIARLRADHPEMFTSEERSLLFYTGDTDSRILEQCEALYRSEVLIIECSFVEVEDRERATRYAHIHADDLFERAGRFENETIVLTHFSLRYSPASIQRTLQRRCPSVLRDRIRLALPEPYSRL
jgi:ribonuclease Z